MERVEELKQSLNAWVQMMSKMGYTMQEIKQALADTINGE